MNAIVVLVTVPAGEVGQSIANAVVGERLAACVNIVPGVFSIYRWQGKIERELEALLLIKTQAERLDALTARVRQLHPYSVPEIIALPVTAGSQPYLDWIAEETAP